LSFTNDAVLDAMTSHYGPTATLIDIDEVLDRRQPFTVIAKLCDIAALRNYTRHDARVGKLVKYWISLICGGWMEPGETKRFTESKGVASFSYSRKGCPGPTAFGTENWRIP